MVRDLVHVAAPIVGALLAFFLMHRITLHLLSN